LSDGILSQTSLTSPIMTDETDKTSGSRNARQDRLKSALRENLKRRKVQARERAATTEPAHGDHRAPHERPAGKTGG
jgi:hypothetical protein